MSAKSAKAARRLINQVSFPAASYEVTIQAVTVRDPKSPLDLLKTKFLPEKKYTVDVDHSRRIRRIARSLHVSIPAAIVLYKMRLTAQA